MTTFFKSISAVTLGILIVPFFAHAETGTTELCTALRALVANFPSPSAALVSSVEGMCPVAVPPVGASLTVACTNARALTVGLHEPMTHAQVKNLQIFLNNSGSVVAQSGDGSFGNETTYFGTKTEIAVQNWQARNGVVMNGTPETTGYGSVGAQTRAKMVQVACGGGVGTTIGTVCTPNNTSGLCAEPVEQTTSTLTRACTDTQAQTYGSGCRICIATGELASNVAGKECTAPVVTLQYYPSTQGLYWGVVRPQTGGTCTASGSWSGTKANSGEYILSSNSGTYSLTCTGASVKTLTVGNQTEVVTAGVSGSGTGSANTGSAPQFSFNLSNNSGDQTATTAKVRWYNGSTGTNAPVSCVATGDWAGTKQIPITGDSSTIRSEVITRGTFDKNLILTCVNAAGVPTVKSLTVTALSSSAASSGTGTTGGTPELVLKVNGSVGPIGVEEKQSMSASWTANVDLTSCGVGAAFADDAETVTPQDSGRSGTITGFSAHRTWSPGTTPQGYDYTMSCKKSNGVILWSNSVRVNVCIPGRHFVADGSFNGGTCVLNTQSTTDTTTGTTGTSQTPSLTLSASPSSCTIPKDKSVCTVPVTINVSGMNSIKYFVDTTTADGQVFSTGQTSITNFSGTKSLDFTVIRQNTKVNFVGYYGSGSTNIQANVVLTASCESGTSWDSAQGVCKASGTTSSTPVPTISASPASVGLDDTITFSWNGVMTSGVYRIKIGSTEVPGTFTQESWSGTMRSLWLSTGMYQAYVRACTSSALSSCGSWSSPVSFTVTSGTAAPKSVSINMLPAAIVKNTTGITVAYVANGFTNPSCSAYINRNLGVTLQESSHSFVWGPQANSLLVEVKCKEVGASDATLISSGEKTVHVCTSAVVSGACSGGETPVLSAETLQSFASLSGAYAQTVSASQMTTTDESLVLTQDLYRGTTGEEVVTLQKALARLGLFSEEITGNFYDTTLEAVRAFQIKYGIKASGYVGSATRAVLNSL